MRRKQAPPGTGFWQAELEAPYQPRVANGAEGGAPGLAREEVVPGSAVVLMDGAPPGHPDPGMFLAEGTIEALIWRFPGKE